MRTDDYISRNRILDEIGRIGGNVGSGWTTLGVITLVAGQPRVDVTPVVRCKVCKWGEAYKNAFGAAGFKCKLLCVDIRQEDFCSYGERRDTNGE